MDRKGKRELVQQLDQQKEQLGHYEARLKDVVRAYKSLQKEKEALESGLKASTLLSPKPQGASYVGDPLSSKVFRESESGNEDEQFKSQMASITSALSTVTAEKSKMEAVFQADRKKLLQEKDDLEKSVFGLQHQLKSLETHPNPRVEELKSRLIVEKHEREQEQQNCGLMLRELQTLVADERRGKESLEMESKESGRELERLRRLLAQRDSQDKRVRDLENEIQSLRAKLGRAESRARLPQELAEEQRRLAEAESRARLIATRNEERVAALEARLAELSQTVGEYDRARQRDQAAILGLKEQLVQIQPLSPTETAASGDDILDAPTLMEKIVRFRSMLLEKDKDAVENFLSRYGLAESHVACKQSYQCLKDEFEILKTKAAQKTDSNQVAALQSDLSASREKCRQLCSELDSLRSDLREQGYQTQRLLSAQQESHSEELATLGSEHSRRVSELEFQLKRQRERSLALLGERDEEIQALRQGCQDKDCDASEAFLKLGGKSTEVHLLLHSQELARKDADIRHLKSARRQLESELRQTLSESDSKEESWRVQRSNLEREIERLSRNESRDRGANLEYLKNVVMSYMVSSDQASRQHMANAIATVLRFSEDETEQVKSAAAAWWWQSGGRKNSTSH